MLDFMLTVYFGTHILNTVKNKTQGHLLSGSEFKDY